MDTQSHAHYTVIVILNVKQQLLHQKPLLMEVAKIQLLIQRNRMGILNCFVMMRMLNFMIYVEESLFMEVSFLIMNRMENHS